jgi:hypothetical protein
LVDALELAARRIEEGMSGKTDAVFQYGGDPGILQIIYRAIDEWKQTVDAHE